MIMLTSGKVYLKRQLLNEAAENLDKPKVIELLKSLRFSTINWCQTYQGETVLHMTVKGGSNDINKQDKVIEILELFLQHGANVNIKNNDGITVLHLAIIYNMRGVIDFLLKRGAGADLMNERSIGHWIIENEYEKLHNTCQCSNMNVFYEKSISFIDWLLSNKFKCDTSKKNQHGETPLHFAVKLNMIYLLPVLLKYTIDPNQVNKYNQTVLHTFIDNLRGGDDSCDIQIPTSYYDYEETCTIMVLKELLIHGLSVDKQDSNGNTAIHLAVRRYRPEILKVLLQNFRNVEIQNNCGATVLHMLIQHSVNHNTMRHKRDYEKFVERLAQIGANVNFKGEYKYYPVQLAVMQGHLPILQILKKYDADFKVFGYPGGNLLHLINTDINKKLLNVDYDKIIELLVNEGCDINAVNEDGKTPLHLAVRSGFIPIVLALIAHGADVNYPDTSLHEYTPLHEAVDRNDETMVDVLVIAGADFNARTTTGRTVLHQAICTRNNVVQKLLKLGAGLYLADKFKCLPLFYAIKQNDVEAVEELLKYGADINDVTVYRAISAMSSESGVVDVVLNHWIKMKAIGLPVLQRYGSCFNIKDYENLYNNYVAEVQTLKCFKITDGISVYDFLHMDWNYRCVYVNNKKLKEFVNLPNIEILYPKYHVLISASYYDAIARKALLDDAKHAWNVLTEIILPDVCIYRILAHLKTSDLSCMIDGAND